MAQPTISILQKTGVSQLWVNNSDNNKSKLFFGWQVQLVNNFSYIFFKIITNSFLLIIRKILVNLFIKKKLTKSVSTHLLVNAIRIVQNKNWGGLEKPRWTNTKILSKSRSTVNFYKKSYNTFFKKRYFIKKDFITRLIYPKIRSIRFVKIGLWLFIIGLLFSYKS